MLQLTAKAFDWALAHIENYGDTDIFPLPFEFKAIRHDWKEIRKYLMSQDLLQWQTRPSRRCLTPKHRYGFRIATQLDPLDSIIFTALIREIGNDIEATRIEKDKNIAFSHRFVRGPKGKMFDENYNWKAFQDHSSKLAANTKYKYVVVADIADFFPRIYAHPLENALDECTKKKDCVRVIKNMLKNWNFTVSYGIPVGVAASRLLAELVLHDTDEALLSEGAIFCRYVDDIRIFCETEREAHERLAFLARNLYDNNGLTLQQNKTVIVPKETFIKECLSSNEKRELDSLARQFKELLDEIGIEADPYQEINFDALDNTMQDKITALNISEVLMEQLRLGVNMDMSLVRFILKRMAQFGNTDQIDLVIQNIDKLYPAFKDVISYVKDVRNIDQERRHQIGEKLLNLIEQSIVGHLEYHRLWVFDIFSENREWDNESKFVSLYHKHNDEFSRRKLILALGRAKQKSWFKTQKREINSFSSWIKRAFLAAASCMPGDEYRHWSRSITRNLDILEKSIVKWASSHPF